MCESSESNFLFFTDEELALFVNISQQSRFEVIREDLKSKLKPSRYSHVLGVAETAVWLALRHGEDIEKAYTAGILHDCAKYLPDSDMLENADHYGIPLDNIERKAVQLVHSKVGACFARDIYGITDEDILNAIFYHTTGRIGMSKLEKIIYIADYIEPTRNWGSDTDIPLIRKYSSTDLDVTLYMILEKTYKYLLETYKDNISDVTRQTFDYYRCIVKLSNHPEFNTQGGDNLW